MSQYRDPLAGLRSQIATKRGALESRERSLPPLLRALLPDRIQEPLSVLRARALAEGDSIDVLTDADAALDGILAAHDEAAALIPTLRFCPDAVPDPPRPKQEPPWIYEEPHQVRVRRLVEQRVTEVDRKAYLVRWGDFTYLARMRVAGAPLVASWRADIIPTEGVVRRFRGALRTSVHDRVPRLEVRPQTMVHGLGKLVGVTQDLLVGQPELDEAFLVGGEEAALALLSPDVASALLSLLPCAPRVTVGDGLVELSWGAAFREPGSELLPDAAFAVALGMRAVIERG